MAAAIFALVVVSGVATSPASALEPTDTGVVLLHGKWADPSQMRAMGETLEAAGFLVERPAMPWAGYRHYDKPYGGAMAEIAEALERLKAKGVHHLVVGGQSLGGNGTLGYAALDDSLDAVVLVAPAHLPDWPGAVARNSVDVARAQSMVADGKGDETASFTDFNSGNRSRPISMPAATYLSYNDPDGPAAMSRTAPKVKVAKILWLAAGDDPATHQFAQLVLPRFPGTVTITRIDLPGASHLEAPAAATPLIVELLKGIN
jgi:dienelactone hydrolase